MQKMTIYTIDFCAMRGIEIFSKNCTMKKYILPMRGTLVL